MITFVTEDMFKEFLPEECLQDVLKEAAELYPKEIESLITFLLKMFKEGFDYQKGATWSIIKYGN